MTLAAGCLLAYVLGSIPFGLLIARSRGVDLRTVGSGNIGASNVSRALGPRWAVVVLVLDAAKGWIPTALVGALSASSLGSPRPWAAPAAGFAAVLGHSASVFLRGRGGKGVATSLGVALALAPASAVAALAVFAVGFGLTRMSSVGSLAATLAFPLLAWRLGEGRAPALAFAAAAGALIVVRHHSNIARLARGVELKS